MAYFHLPRHLYAQHAEEQDAAEILAADAHRRKALLTRLRNLGAEQHNIQIKGAKIILIMKSQTFKVSKLTGFIGDAFYDDAMTNMPSAKILQNNNNRNLTILNCIYNKTQ